MGVTPTDVVDAIYGGNDDTVLVGRVTANDWWQRVGGRLDLCGEDVRRLWRDLDQPEQWDEPLIIAMREATSARTAILSNAWPLRRGLMTRLGLDGLVDELGLSCDIGVAKPDHRAFELTLERLGTSPSRTLFIDDTPDNVAAATAMGIRGHIHVDTARTIDMIRGFVA